MKHRLTGAVVMVVAAVLIIPFLLSEPDTSASSATDTASGDSFQQIFKSKIQPLTLDTVNITGKDDSIEDGEALQPALLDSREVTAISVGDGKATKVEPQASDDATPKKTEEQSSSQIVLTTPTQTNSKEKAKVAEPAPATESVSESGWTVRVGTYSKLENVTSISSLLEDSGFKARHTTVQTTLGEATRVWLGPYDQREKADKVSDRLKKLTGEKGYVTKHT